MDPVERQRLMEEGRRAFNRGEFYEAHESWEAVWDVIDDPDRTWVQGLIQIATGFHKLQRDRPDVCRTLLQKGLAKLAGAPPVLDGYAVGKLRDDAARAYHVLAAGAAFDPLTVKLDETS